MNTTPALTLDTRDDTTESSETQYEFACGHLGPKPAHMTAGPDLAAWLKRNNQCLPCWTQSVAETNHRFADDHGLPPLRGSNGQIRWAETVRREKLEHLEERIRLAQGLSMIDEVESFSRTFEALTNVESAKAWIDARYVTAEAFLAKLTASLRPVKRPRKTSATSKPQKVRA